MTAYGRRLQGCAVRWLLKRMKSPSTVQSATELLPLPRGPFCSAPLYSMYVRYLGRLAMFGDILPLSHLDAFLPYVAKKGSRPVWMPDRMRRTP